MSQQVREDLLQRKAVVLEYFTHRKQKEKKKKSRGLSAKQRRELRLFDIKPEQQRYARPFPPWLKIGEPLSLLPQGGSLPLRIQTLGLSFLPDFCGSSTVQTPGALSESVAPGNRLFVFQFS